MEINWAELRAAAVEVMGRAYAPYSKFPVGAAGLVDDGRVVVGCNVENAAYGVVLCAECGVVSALHASGGGRLVALSCVDGTGDPLMPCGRCRQLLWEHGGPDCLVDARGAPRRMAELLPHAFDVTDLDAVGPAERDPVVPARLLGWRGHGTVFVHADLAGGVQVWTGYWERSEATDGPGGETGILEEAPTWPDAADAVAWGRARTPRIVVIEPDGAALWAGEGQAPPGLAGNWAPRQQPPPPPSPPAPPA
ncbi:MAG TPA: cytidine deaminase [Micromonosporaceae bacterium]|nr:cytidine deaminase [Micromonosporaceae bacterium]